MNFKKTIFTGFAPNLTKQDVKIALKFLFLPAYWLKLKTGDSLDKVEQYLKNYFNIKYAVLFDSGRSALCFAIKSLDIKPKDEIIMQAYTCVVVVNAIKFAGAKPVYADIDDTGNLDPDDLLKKINKNTRSVIIQHTFGVPANLDKIIEICGQNNIKIIEDCAHSFGAVYKGRKIGNFGDMAIFSFGSDKVVSCNRGGAVITNNEVFANRLADFKTCLSNTSTIKIIQHLLHFPIFYIGKLSYSFAAGKLLLFLAKKLNIINKIIYKPEKYGKQVLFYPAKMPNCLAEILFDQLKNLAEMNSHHMAIAKLYKEKINNNFVIVPSIVEGAVFLRFNILTNKVKELKKIGKKDNIIFGDWYDTVIAPKDIEFKNTDYVAGSCKKAEEMAKLSINLPTDINITEADAWRIIKAVNSL